MWVVYDQITTSFCHFRDFTSWSVSLSSHNCALPFRYGDLFWNYGDSEYCTGSTLTLKAHSCGVPTCESDTAYLCVSRVPIYFNINSHMPKRYSFRCHSPSKHPWLVLTISPCASCRSSWPFNPPPFVSHFYGPLSRNANTALAHSAMASISYFYLRLTYWDKASNAIINYHWRFSSVAPLSQATSLRHLAYVIINSYFNAKTGIHCIDGKYSITLPK